MKNSDILVINKPNKKYKSRMKNFTISVEPELYTRFKKLAKEYNINQSKTIARYLEELCNKIEKEYE